MPLKLYNTLTKRKEEFIPLEPPLVKLYVCGITPYDKSHVGHLRTYVVTDLLRRTLRFLGYLDIAVTNFTDIDDKIIRKSKETGKDWKEIAEENINYLFEQLKKINVLPFNVYPRVTYHINEIADAVETLLWRGFAYKGRHGIYYEVDKYPWYGQLSGIKEKKKWEQEKDYLSDKKKPYDFALWKFRKEGGPYWETNVGEGRPGWHIECSVMSSRYLGYQFDIHLGGQDLIFPHHENEIAQSEALFMVRPWVRYWVHIGYVTINNEKMSKSLGNIIPADEFIKDLTPMVARYFLATTSYRKPLDVNEQNIDQAKKNYEYLTKTIKTLQSILAKEQYSYYLENNKIELMNRVIELEKKFVEYMLDNLDTTNANATLLELAKLVNKEVIPSENYSLVYTAYRAFETANRFFAVWDEIFFGKKEENLEPKLIELLIEIRKELRKQKNFELADKIREELKKLGIELLDKGLKTEWRKL